MIHRFLQSRRPKHRRHRHHPYRGHRYRQKHFPMAPSVGLTTAAAATPTTEGSSFNRASPKAGAVKTTTDVLRRFSIARRRVTSTAAAATS